MIDKLNRLIHEYAADIILALLAIAIFVLTPKLLTIVTGATTSKDAIDITINLLGAILAVFAAIASYRRFFKGRVFSPRLKVGLTQSPIREMDDQSLLHIADVEIENVGGVTVWNPEVQCRVLELDDDVACTIGEPKTEGVKQQLKRGGIPGIEPSEIVVHHFRFRVPLSVHVFRISVDVSVDGRDAWHRSLTVSNAGPE